ncbi:MAG: transglycosylase SLT domain-containing protein [Bacteroidales bacterium]|nr:transglycosylase SLT domain-containing protein [Candidatus Colicola coprequi]
MKHLFFTILLLCTCSVLHAQVSEPVSSDTLFQDSVCVEEQLSFDQTLAWIDTTACTSDTVIIDLPDSVYKARLQELPFVVEVPYNQVVRGYITRYLKSARRLAMLCRMSEYYFPMFEDKLNQYDLPYELAYMAVIESALNPQARSRMGAVGLWQFMPSTGKIYGLEINSLVDERMDPVRSTDAACRMLRSLYGTFQDWNLVIAAYNCGPGNVKKAIARAGGKRDFWSIYPYLPRETRGYLPIFIAATYAMNYADAHGICPAYTDRTMVTDTIITQDRIHLQQVADMMQIDLQELRRLNPQYARDILPGGSKAYALCLPEQRAVEFIQMRDTILNHRADELVNNRRAEIDLLQKTSLNGGYSVNGITYYKIKSGDTLGGIAKKFHCTVKQLQRWNHLKDTTIRAGKTLRIGG